MNTNLSYAQIDAKRRIRRLTYENIYAQRSSKLNTAVKRVTKLISDIDFNELMSELGGINIVKLALEGSPVVLCAENKYLCPELVTWLITED